MSVTRDKGVDVAEAAVHLLTGARGSGHQGGPTLDEATQALAHIEAPAGVWRRAVAYLAAQLLGERSRAAADANLALHHIRRAIAEHDERAERAKEHAAKAAQITAQGAL